MGDALTYLSLHVQGRSSWLVGQIVAASQQWCIHRTTQRLHSSLGGCYNTRVAPGSGVCREARDGACVRHAEEHSVDSGRHGMQSNGAHDSVQGMERVRAPEDTCTPSSSAASGQCETSSSNVLIGENTYCSKCSTTDTEAPIDGVCKTINGDASGCTAQTPPNGTCKSCGAGYFLHKGGCYKIADPPGSTICSAAGTAGICQTCKDGYFKNPANAATSDSCIACSDTSIIDSVTGVAGCTTCSPPSAAGDSNTPKAATCTACGDSKIVKTAADVILLRNRGPVHRNRRILCERVGWL